MGIAEARKRNRAARVRAYAERRRGQLERQTGRLFYSLETELVRYAKPLFKKITEFAADYRRIQNPDAPLDVNFSPLEPAVEKMLRAAYVNGRWSGYRYIRDITAVQSGGKHPPRIVRLDDWPPVTDAAFLTALRAFLDGRPESEWAGVVPPGLKAYFEVYSKQIVSVYQEDIDDVIQKIIMNAVNAGNTLNEKIDALWINVKGLGMKPRWMVDRIARTETTRAYSLGNLQSTIEAALDGSGSIVGFRFSAILDSRVSDICERRHGLKMKIDDPRLPKNTPPLHPNCRSMLIPLWEWDIEEEGWESKAKDGEMKYDWNTAPPSIQREQDVELVRAMLEQSGWRAGSVSDTQAGLLPKTAPKSDFDPEKERRKIISGEYNLRVSSQKQNRHIEGTAEYERYAARMQQEGKEQKPSVLVVDPQALIEKYAGSGTIERKGSVYPTETVHASGIVGKYWAWKNGRWVETEWFKIVYSKTGPHIYPVYGDDEK
jgi:SPP1 gp7 family putative phage head morphogenesis protein